MQNTNSTGTVLSILFVADVLIANVIGGAERVLYEESTRLALQRHTVKVLTRKLPYHESEVGVLSSINRQKVPLVYTCHSLSFEEYISRSSSPLLR